MRGVRKVTSGTGDVSPTAAASISRAVGAMCCNDPLSWQPIWAGNGGAFWPLNSLLRTLVDARLIFRVQQSI